MPTMFGKGIMQKGIPHQIEFILTWLAFAFIGIGILTGIRKYKEMSFPELDFKKPDFLKEKFEVGYFVIALACSGLLVAMVALPFISAGYGIQRLYATAITILSVFFVIGGIMIAKYLNKLLAVLQGKAPTNNASQVRAYLIILLVLIPYFFCVTGVTYEMFGYPRQITLNSKGEQQTLLVYDQDSYGVKWLGDYTEKRQRIYTDFIGGDVLASQSQGRISLGQTDRGSLIERRKINGYIYLRYYNTIEDKLDIHKGGSEIYNTSDYRDIFIEKNKIYANGGSEVYKT
jgi:uncharacterized membrane protein